MGRWTQYDEDSYRLPEGMRRIGYDADTGRYIFEDRSGASYQSAPGSEYGILTPNHRAADTRARSETSNTVVPASVEEQEEVEDGSIINSKISSGLRRLPGTVSKIMAMRTLTVSRMRNPRSDRTLHRTKSLPPLPPPSPSSSQTQTTQIPPWPTHRRGNYSQAPETIQVGPKAKSLFHSLTVFAQSSIRFSNQRSSQPRPSGSPSQALMPPTNSMITSKEKQAELTSPIAPNSAEQEEVSIELERTPSLLEAIEEWKKLHNSI